MLPRWSTIYSANFSRSNLPGKSILSISLKSISISYFLAISSIFFLNSCRSFNNFSPISIYSLYVYSFSRGSTKSASSGNSVLNSSMISCASSSNPNNSVASASDTPISFFTISLVSANLNKFSGVAALGNFGSLNTNNFSKFALFSAETIPPYSE